MKRIGKNPTLDHLVHTDHQIVLEQTETREKPSPRLLRPTVHSILTAIMSSHSETCVAYKTLMARIPRSNWQDKLRPTLRPDRMPCTTMIGCLISSPPQTAASSTSAAQPIHPQEISWSKVGTKVSLSATVSIQRSCSSSYCALVSCPASTVAIRRSTVQTYVASGRDEEREYSQAYGMVIQTC